MIKEILAIGAVIGGIIGAAAYIPQIKHLLQVKDSSGISMSAMWMWFTESILLLLYAINIKDLVYIFVYTVFLICCAIVIYLTLKYKKS